MADTTERDGELRTLALSQIEVVENHNPRSCVEDETFDELVASVAQRGVLQPVIVAAGAGGTYRLVAGERRVRAAATGSSARRKGCRSSRRLEPGVDSLERSAHHDAHAVPRVHPALQEADRTAVGVHDDRTRVPCLAERVAVV